MGCLTTWSNIFLFFLRAIVHDFRNPVFKPAVSNASRGGGGGYYLIDFIFGVNEGSVFHYVF